MARAFRRWLAGAKAMGQFYWTRKWDLWWQFAAYILRRKDFAWQRRQIHFSAWNEYPGCQWDGSRWEICLPDCCVVCGETDELVERNDERSVTDLFWPLLASVSGVVVGIAVGLFWRAWSLPIPILVGWLLGYCGRGRKEVQIDYYRCQKHLQSEAYPRLWTAGDRLCVQVGHSFVKARFLGKAKGVGVAAAGPEARAPEFPLPVRRHVPATIPLDEERSAKTLPDERAGAVSETPDRPIVCPAEPGKLAIVEEPGAEESWVAEPAAQRLAPDDALAELHPSLGQPPRARAEKAEPVRPIDGGPKTHGDVEGAASRRASPDAIQRQYDDLLTSADVSPEDQVQPRSATPVADERLVEAGSTPFQNPGPPVQPPPDAGYPPASGDSSDLDDEEYWVSEPAVEQVAPGQESQAPPQRPARDSSLADESDLRTLADDSSANDAVRLLRHGRAALAGGRAIRRIESGASRSGGRCGQLAFQQRKGTPLRRR